MTSARTLPWRRQLSKLDTSSNCAAFKQRPATNALAYSVAALALILLPGPSVLFVIGRSLSLGQKGGVLSVVGNALSTLPAITAQP